MNGSCEECRFWEAFVDPYDGLCRRNPPTCDMKAEFTVDHCGAVALWPITNFEDWCGAFETKKD